MNLLYPLASLLGVEVEHLADRLKRGALLYGTVSALALVGVVFVLAALNAWLTTLWGPVIAPLAIAAGALVLALFIYAGARFAGDMTARRIEARKHTFERTALVTTAAMSAMPLLLKSGLMRRIGLPVGGALAALYLLRLPSGRSEHPKLDDHSE